MLGVGTDVVSGEVSVMMQVTNESGSGSSEEWADAGNNSRGSQ